MISWFVDIGQLALAFAGFSLLVLLVSRSALAGAIVVLGSFCVFEAASPPLVDLVVTFGSFSVHPIDVTSVALLAVAVPRLFSQEIFGPAKIALLTLFVLLITHLAWGIVEFGLQPAINNSRIWFSIMSGLIFGATVKNWDRRLVTAFIVTGSFLAAFSIFSILRDGLYSANTYIERGGELVDARPVMSLGVLLMLEALILLLARGRFTFGVASLTLLLASGIALLQYRTLWVTAIAAAVLGGFYLAVRYRASNERVVYLLTAATLALVPLLLFATSLVSTYQQSARSATGSASTLTWRVEAWKELIEKHDSAFDLLFGTPSGTGREIEVGGLVTDLSAHNMYVEAVLLYGLVGLLPLCVLAVLALGFRYETAGRLEIAPPAVVILVASIGLVALAHTPTQPHGLLFGCLASAACFQTQASPARERVARPGGLVASQ